MLRLGFCLIVFGLSLPLPATAAEPAPGLDIHFIDTEGGQCSGAAYQPFPELLAELRHLKEKK